LPDERQCRVQQLAADAATAGFRLDEDVVHDTRRSAERWLSNGVMASLHEW
jgi:hypothetical protein